MKQLGKPSEGYPLAQSEAASQWLTRFEDCDRTFNCDFRDFQLKKSPTISCGMGILCVL